MKTRRNGRLRVMKKPLRGNTPKWLSVKWEKPFFSFDDPIVWVGVSKLDASWRRDDLYIGRFGLGDNQPVKYDKFGLWIVKLRNVHMAHISLSPDGMVSFSDGRHRFAWLRDNGATALPVTVDPQNKGEIKKRFGTRVRVCRIRTLTL